VCWFLWGGEDVLAEVEARVFFHHCLPFMKEKKLIIL